MSVPANHFDTYTVGASPTDATEAVIGTLSGITELWPGLAINLDAWVNVTPDASTALMTLNVRRGSITGTVVGTATADGPATITKGTIVNMAVQCGDNLGNFTGAVYVLTLTCASAGGAGVVNALHLGARVG